MAAQRLVAVGSPTLPIPSVTSSPCRPFSSLRSHLHLQSGAFWKRKTPTKILISLSSTSSGSKLAALPFDLSPPPIDHDLLETVTLAGAKVSDDGIIETFNNDDEALDAADNGVVERVIEEQKREERVIFLYDPHAMVFGVTGQVLFKFSSLDHIDFSLSHPNTRPQLGSSNGSEVKSLTGGCGPFTFWTDKSGEDRIQFLHNQSTANFECLHEGQGCDTVFVTPTARTIDIAHAWIMKNAVTLVVSPDTCQSIIKMLNKYIFLADKVEIQDITKQTCLFVLLGPKSNQVMEDLNLGYLVGQAYGTHQHFSVSGMPITIGVGNVISEEGFSLLMSPAAAGSVWSTILSQGAIPMGSNAWEKLRVLRGRPAPQKELTNEFNVLEAGLWNSISLNKGCYKGQETISRLITYNGVKQRLWGLCLSAPAEPGTPITLDGKKLGKVTSYASGRKESEHFGLGYIKRQTVSEGDTVTVGENVTGTVVEVPFLSRQCQPTQSSGS